MRSESDLPHGLVTFLMTDVQASARLWEDQPETMALSVARLDELASKAVSEHRGHLVKARGEGDSHFIVFATGSDALRCALAFQLALNSEPWPAETPIRVRMALHVGDVQLRHGDYYGPTVNRCARLRAIAHGGQTILSRAVLVEAGKAVPEGASFRDLGVHRLKDLGRPEEVLQLCYPDLPSDFPPLRSLDVLPHNLPIQTTRLLGREEEIGEVIDRLHQTRVVTLTGAGGLGKTRLALQAAAESLDDFSGGAWFVDLAGLNDPTLVPVEVAKPLGLREEPGRKLVDTLTDFLESRSALIVLDNCEHLIEACAELVSGLLRVCPEVTVLATSREHMGVPGEVVWRVSPLPVPSPDAPLDPELLLQVPSVALFCDRAALAKPSFRLTRVNARAVIQICKRLDGIPLAIELAASRVGVLAPTEIAARLDDMFGLLSLGPRTARTRQKTLERAIDWSYNLLNEDERTLFRALSVFAGSFTLEAVESMAVDESKNTALDLLSSLINKSMIISEEDDGGTRYRMLEPIRAFAVERLRSAGEEETARDRHLAYFRLVAERAEPALTGPDLPGWLLWFDQEHDNLRAALAWGLERGKKDSVLLSVSLFRFFDLRGQFSEGRQWFSLAAKLAPGGALRTKVLNASGSLSYAQGDLPSARALHDEALAISREIGDKRQVAISLHNLGNVAQGSGDYSSVRVLREEALGIFREIGDKWGIAVSLHNLSNLAHAQGEFSAARALREESLAVSRDIGDKRGVANTLNGLGNLAFLQGDHHLARAFHEEAVALSREIGDKRGLATFLNNLGATAQATGDYRYARDLLEESLNICREVGHKRGEAFSLTGLGDIARAEDENSTARQLYEEGLAMFLHIGDRPFVAYSLNNLGTLARLGDDKATARQLHDEALTIFRDIGDKRGIAYSLRGFGALAVETGWAAQGGRLLGAAAALGDELGIRLETMDSRYHEHSVAKARALLGEEQFDRAWAEGRLMSTEEAISSALAWAADDATRNPASRLIDTSGSDHSSKRISLEAETGSETS